jgi:hypothetical protein
MLTSDEITSYLSPNTTVNYNIKFADNTADDLVIRPDKFVNEDIYNRSFSLVHILVIRLLNFLFISH